MRKTRCRCGHMNWADVTTVSCVRLVSGLESALLGQIGLSNVIVSYECIRGLNYPVLYSGSFHINHLNFASERRFEIAGSGDWLPVISRSQALRLMFRQLCLIYWRHGRADSETTVP